MISYKLCDSAKADLNKLKNKNIMRINLLIELIILLVIIKMAKKRP